MPASPGRGQPRIAMLTGASVQQLQLTVGEQRCRRGHLQGRYVEGWGGMEGGMAVAMVFVQDFQFYPFWSLKIQMATIYFIHRQFTRTYLRRKMLMGVVLTGNGQSTGSVGEGSVALVRYAGGKLLRHQLVRGVNVVHMTTVHVRRRARGRCT